MGKKAKIAGIVLHVLIGGLMVFAGSMKLFTTPTGEMLEQMKAAGVADHVKLIGAGEIITATLLIVPITSSLGVLLTTGFWGGVICQHLTHDGGIYPGIAFMILTWVGGYLRNKQLFASFYNKPE